METWCLLGSTKGRQGAAIPIRNYIEVPKEILSQFGCGLCLSKGMFAGRYVIPVHNPQGELVGYAGRALDEETEPRYLFPPSDKGFYKSHLLFNLQRIAWPALRGGCL
jgi:DNA primase catalytic core, N-terminal domain